MIKIPELMDLLKAGVHFGHRKSKWHPKMAPFIFGEKNGIHIIDVQTTQVKIKEALAFIDKVVTNGGKVLFLGTKPQAKELVKKAAIDCGMPYIVERWLGGTITNSQSVLGLAKKLSKLKTERDLGELEKYTKKERLEIGRTIAKLDKLVGGIEKMTNLPEVIFVIDCKKEKTAILEANRRGIPVLAITDTNINVNRINYPIPANDDAVNSINLIVDLIKDQIIESKQVKK